MTNPIIRIGQAAYDLHQEYGGAAVRVIVAPENGPQIAVSIGWPDPDENEEDDE